MKIFSIRILLVLQIIAALCLFVTACGGSSASQSNSVAGSRGFTATSSNIGPSQSISGDYDSDDDYNDKLHGDADNDDSTKPKDRDNDSDNTSNSYYDKDDNVVLHYGHATNAQDRRTITALVKRYFAAAARQDGASACSMIASSLANSVAETLGGKAGPAYSRGNTCAAVMSKLFYHYHRQLAAHESQLEVTAVRLDGPKGIAVLGFKTLPGRQLHVARENAVWKIDALLDLELP